MDTVEALRWMSSPAAPVIGQAADEIERLRMDNAQAKEAIAVLSAGRPLGDIVGKHTAQNAIAEVERLRAEVAMLRTGDTCARMCEGTAYRIMARHLKARLECDPDRPELDGIYRRDATIRLQGAEIAKLRAEVEALRSDLSMAARLLDEATACQGLGPDAALHWWSDKGAIQEKYLQRMTDEAQAMGLYDVPGDEKR